MTYFLDTDVCIHALRGTGSKFVQKISRLAPKQIKIPSIVKAELLLGARKSSDPHKALILVEKFLAPFEIVPFDSSAAESYAELRSYLENKGQSIGPNDTLIAATVVAHQGILISHNQKEFARVPDLRTEDWL